MAPRAKRFEDLVAWQKSRALTSAIYTVTKEGALARDYGLAGQMQRAAVSVMSNIAEGFERNGSREFCQFLSLAKGSCGELRSHLYVAQDVHYLDGMTCQSLVHQAEEVSRIIAGLRAAILDQAGTMRRTAANHRESQIEP